MGNHREYTNKLLQMIEEGLLDAKDVLNDALGYMSEDDVKDFAITEYASLFGEEGDEESCDYIQTYEDSYRADDSVDVYADAADLYLDPRDDEDGRLDSTANHEAMVNKCNSPE